MRDSHLYLRDKCARFGIRIHNGRLLFSGYDPVNPNDIEIHVAEMLFGTHCVIIYRIFETVIGTLTEMGTQRVRISLFPSKHARHSKSLQNDYKISRYRISSAKPVTSAINVASNNFVTSRSEKS